MEVDSCLQSDRHFQKVSHKTSQKVTLLRRKKHLLNPDGLMTIYKAQIRTIMDYASLTGMSRSSCHFNLLVKVKRRAESLLGGIHPQPSYQGQRQHRDQNEDDKQMEQTIRQDSLKNRKRMTTLIVLPKAQMVQVSHLTRLRITRKRPMSSTISHNV